MLKKLKFWDLISKYDPHCYLQPNIDTHYLSKYQIQDLFLDKLNRCCELSHTCRLRRTTPATRQQLVIQYRAHLLWLIQQVCKMQKLRLRYYGIDKKGRNLYQVEKAPRVKFYASDKEELEDNEDDSLKMDEEGTDCQKEG